MKHIRERQDNFFSLYVREYFNQISLATSFRTIFPYLSRHKIAQTVCSDFRTSFKVLAEAYVVPYVGQNIQEWTKQNLWKTAFKKFEVIWSA